jgi:hypothetical protein
MTAEPQVRPGPDDAWTYSPITESWLSTMGFKWSQLEGQPTKHWTLWIGECCGAHVAFEDLGLELAKSDEDWWHCWLRADYAGRYTRFLHVRHMRTTDDVRALIRGLIGREFDWADVLYGALRTPESARRIRAEQERMDVRMALEHRWRTDEQDETKDLRVRS